MVWNIRKSQSNSTTEVRIHRSNFFDFWRFIYERQMIYHRRFELKLPPPWTEDEWLRDYKFTNIYRELDRGTIWLVNYVKKHPQIQFYEKDIVFTVIAYRILNRIETFETIGYIPTYRNFQPKKIYRDLNEIAKTGKAVFTNAHSLPPAPKGKTKIYGYIDTLYKLYNDFEDIFDRIKKAKTFKEVFDILRTIHRIGPFYSYEACCDLVMLGVIPFTLDDWANPGPGCKQGIDLIFPNRQAISYEQAIKTLRNCQQRVFRRLGVHFPYWQGKPLSLRNIEHSLCEFGKLWRLQRKIGRYRLRFVDSNHKIEREYNVY